MICLIHGLGNIDSKGTCRESKNIIVQKVSKMKGYLGYSKTKRETGKGTGGFGDVTTA